MNVSKLQQIINEMADEIDCDGKGRIGSHDIPSLVSFYVSDDDCDYELEEIEYSRLGGCGCASGIIFRLKKL